jgi:hypothetical protein
MTRAWLPRLGGTTGLDLGRYRGWCQTGQARIPDHQEATYRFEVQQMKTATRSSLAKLLTFLNHLEEANISYKLDHVRDAIMIIVTVPGERWEIEFFEDDRVEVERFTSSGSMGDETALDELLTKHGDS